MKFFTLENYFAVYEDTDEEAFPRRKAAYESYLAHIEVLKSQHPSQVWDIASPFLVDDALLARVSLDRPKQTLEIVLRCGNLQDEYFDLVVRYENVEISPDSELALATVARATKTSRLFYAHDCYMHELGLTDDGRYEHNLLFHPGLAVTITSCSLSWDRIPRPGRTLPRSKDRFPGGPPTPPPSMDGYKRVTLTPTSET